MNQQDNNPSITSLRRTLGPVTLMFYGVGGMLGAGIYGLVGKVASQLGNAVWLAFVVAMTATLFTGLSYAAIGSHFPRAAGAAYVAERAYRRTWLGYVVGLCVVASGLTSMATGAHIIGAEFGKMGLGAAPFWISFTYLVLLGSIVYCGIRESMGVNIVCTIVEVGGLLLIIIPGIHFWGSVDYLQGPVPAPGEVDTADIGLSISLVMSTAALAFYSFIGFEDILNVSEEVRNPQRDVPIGLIGAMLITAVIYSAVAITAVSVGLTSQALSDGGLRAVAGVVIPWFPQDLYSVITIFAVANTGLLNFVMASRLIYGMASRGLLPAFLAPIHPKRQTPHIAVLALLGICLVLLAIGHLTELASATVLLLLGAFVVVNIALVILMRRGEVKGGFGVPIFVPVLGAGICFVLLGYRIMNPPADGDNAAWIAGCIVLLTVLLYRFLRPQTVE